MSPFVLITLATTAAYVLLMGGAALVVALKKHRGDGERVSDDALPDLTIIVPARDEEAALPACLKALQGQDYPAGRLRILVADDHSTDGTAAAIARATALQGHPVTRVDVPDPTPVLRGKANALHAALEASTTDLVLLTDADCTPPPGWARALASALDPEDVGMACGRTRVGGDHAWARVQTLDWAFLLSSAASLAELGLPTTAMGNNMGLRRAAYDAVGGYPTLGYSVTEDYALLRAVATRTPFRVRFPLDGRLANVTQPAPTLAEAYRQRRRWVRGGLKPPPWLVPVYALVPLAHALPLALLVVAPALGALALAGKLAADAAFLLASLERPERGALAAFPLWEAWLYAYVLTLPLSLLLAPRIHWKGRTS